MGTCQGVEPGRCVELGDAVAKAIVNMPSLYSMMLLYIHANADVLISLVYEVASVNAPQSWRWRKRSFGRRERSLLPLLDVASAQTLH